MYENIYRSISHKSQNVKSIIKCPPALELENKCQTIHIIQFFTAMKMKKQFATSCDRDESDGENVEKKNTFHMTSLMDVCLGMYV